MSADVVAIRGELMAPADEAHRRLSNALARVEADYWTVADAIHEAYVEEVWLRDDRAHEARYRAIMLEQNLTSIFPAYCFDEFGLRAAYIGYLNVAGRLRAVVANPSTRVDGLDWSRFTLGAVRPIGAAIVDTYEPDDVATALATAQRLASKDAAEHPKPGRQTEIDRASVKPSHVRAALVEHGMVPPRAKGLDEMEQAERRAAKLERAEIKARDGLDLLIAERRRKVATDIITAAIRRLSDHPASLARIRQALDEVTA